MEPREILHRLNYMTELVYPTIFTKMKKAHDKRNLYFMKNNRIIHSFLQPDARVFVKDELRSKKDNVVNRVRIWYDLCLVHYRSAFPIRRHKWGKRHTQNAS